MVDPCDRSNEGERPETKKYTFVSPTKFRIYAKDREDTKNVTLKECIDLAKVCSRDLRP